MDYPKMDLLLKIPLRMSTIERTELIMKLYFHCTYHVYFRAHGDVQLNPRIALVSLHLHDVIGHHNNNIIIVLLATLIRGGGGCSVGDKQFCPTPIKCT